MNQTQRCSQIITHHMNLTFSLPCFSSFFSLHQYHYFLLFISNRKGSGSAFMFHHSVLKIFSNLFVSHLIAFSLSHTIMSNYKAAVVLQPESLYYFVSELLLPTGMIWTRLFNTITSASAQNITQKIKQTMTFKSITFQVSRVCYTTDIYTNNNWITDKSTVKVVLTCVNKTKYSWYFTTKYTV